MTGRYLTVEPLSHDAVVKCITSKVKSRLSDAIRPPRAPQAEAILACHPDAQDKQKG